MKRVYLRRDGADLRFADDRHATDETLERYSMSRLAGPELAEFEEHLLVCEACQQRLAREDALRQAIRDGAEALQQQPVTTPWWRSPRLAWTLALAAVALAIFLGIASRSLKPTGPPAVILLQATRGADNSASAAPAAKPLMLVPDLTGLPHSSSYKVEVVDSGGHAVHQSTGTVQNNRLEIPIAGGLKPGNYFLRVYARGGELLREYALAVRG